MLLMRRHAPRSAALLLGLLLLAALAQAVRVPGTGVQPLVSLTTLFAAEQPPACVRDAPSSRWAVVAAVKDKSKAAVFCYGSRAHKCYRRATCCAWYKNKEECAASLAAARDNREGTYLQQLHCGKQLCAANGKSGFDVPGSKTWCEKGWSQFYPDLQLPQCSCADKVGRGPQKICTKDPE